MSQHPSFPPHLPRGAVAASALTLPKNAPTTVLRAGTSPAIQIPAAPSVPSVSVSVPGLPAALGRNPVITAIRPGTPPTTRSPSPAVSMADHPRPNLIVQGAAPTAGAPIPGQPLQITLTQRVNPGAPTVSLSEAMKLTSLGGKTMQVGQAGLLQHPKVQAGTQSATGPLAGISMAAHLQQPTMLTKPGGLQVSGAVPAISISSLSAPMPTATVMAPASTSIPIAKVTPQRQQMPLTSGLPTPIAVQAITSGSEFTALPDLSAIGTQAGASQLLLSQTQRSQAGTVVTTAAAGSLSAAAASLAPQHGDRPLQPTVFNLTAAAPNAPGQGQDVWLSHFFYPNARTQLVPTANPSPLVRPATNTFFVPRPGAEQSKITAQTPNLAASLSHPLNPGQPAMLFNAHMMVDSLRQNMPLSAAPASLTAAVSSAVSSMATGVGGPCDSKAVISLASSGTNQPGLHASLIAASTAAVTSQSDSAAFSSSASLHIAANLASGGCTGSSVLSPNLGLSAMTSLSSRATVASSIVAAASAHQAQSGSNLQPSAPGTPGGANNANASSSPRPSILRKRTADGANLPRKPNFSLMAESHSPRPETAPLSNISSPKTPATENSQSSTDTALSSNDATTPTHNNHGDSKIKTELFDGAENGSFASASPSVNLVGSITDASPRKRARKQLFDIAHRNVNEEMKDNSSSDEEMDSKPELKELKEEHPLQFHSEYIDDEGVRWTREKTKPAMSIMSEYSVNWKPRFNHFQRHTDVRPKDDRNPTVNELISQRGILQKASGWKLHYVSAQVEDVIENEESMEQRMEKLKERLTAKAQSHSSNEQDYNKLLELTRGNLQRCQVVRQQMMEARSSMLNILKHEPKIKEIIHKNLAKRTIKKKERS